MEPVSLVDDVSKFSEGPDDFLVWLPVSVDDVIVNAIIDAGGILWRGVA